MKPKFKTSDVVKIKSLNIEGMIVSVGLDLETNKNKYQVYISEDYVTTYFCLEEDLELKTDLDTLIAQAIEEDSVKGNA